MKRTKGGQL